MQPLYEAPLPTHSGSVPPGALTCPQTTPFSMTSMHSVVTCFETAWSTTCSKAAISNIPTATSFGETFRTRR